MIALKIYIMELRCVMQGDIIYYLPTLYQFLQYNAVNNIVMM
jgi:hypothetical protein